MSAQPAARQLSFVVVAPDRGNAFYGELAARVHLALREAGERSRLVRSSALADLADEGRAEIALLVNPYECALAGERFVAATRGFRRRLAVLSECVEMRWYAYQFATGVDVDGVVDVGFVDQSPLHGVRKPPYAFVFNGYLPAERAAIEAQEPGEPRPIAWCVIGHRTDERVELVDRLLGLDPAGFAFLPSRRPVRPGSSVLSPDAVRSVLRRSDRYVWRAHHDHPYFESFRFVDALLCGAAPTKVGSDGGDVPGVVRDVGELRDRPAAEFFTAARDFYLGRGPLSEHLVRALPGMVQ